MEKNYYKIVKDGIIIAVGYGYNANIISKNEYNNILSIIKTAPQEDGYEYKLKEDLTWDRVELNEEELKAEE